MERGHPPCALPARATAGRGEQRSADIAPTSFDGTWSIQLHSDDFIDYATLSLTYVRYSNTNRYGWMSRLFYSVAGHGVVPWIMMIGGSA